MLKKINDILAGIPATVISGLCLALSFFFSHAGIRAPADPAWISVFISGVPLLYLAVWRIIHNPGLSKISSALLITIAMFAAVAIGDLFAAGEVAFIMSVGAILEDMTANRAKKGVKDLVSLMPAQARKLTPDGEVLIAAETLKAGDIIRILPGESLPADGLIVDGATSIDQSIMTGESLPVDKAVDDQVFCGTLNCFGSIDIRVTDVGPDSSLKKLIRMVEEAEEKRAPMARTADRFASLLVPAVLLIAVIAWLITRDMVQAVTILVVFCPCALILATPTAVMAAIGQAAKHGVIIKSGEALEKMGKVDTVVFDKTGTLTYGKMQVSDVLVFHVPGGGSSAPEAQNRFPSEAPGMKLSPAEKHLLSLAASTEVKSEHPLGRAIVSYARLCGAVIQEPDEFSMILGRGVRAKTAGKLLLCGNEAFLAENGCPLPPKASEAAERLRSQGKVSVLIAVQDKCMGLVALSDQLRPDAADTVKELNTLTAGSILLTGDNQRTAAYFAEKTGIRKVFSGLLPDEKVAMLRKLQSENKTVCMVGDGVNDAPALKTADVGVAMGCMGSDIAVDAADVALMSDDLTKLPYLKRLSDATVHTIKLSIALSMCINFAAVTLSVMGLLNPTTGALVHNAGSCLVILIAALLYDRKFD